MTVLPAKIQDLHSLAAWIAMSKDKAGKVSDDELESAGIKSEDAKKYDVNKDGLDSGELFTYLNAQTSPLTITADGVEYTVKNGVLMPRGEIAPQVGGAKTEKVGQPVSSKDMTLEEKIIDKLVRLAAASGITLKRDVIEQLLRERLQNGFIVIDDHFKELLAKALGVPKKEITDAALDAVFGDQKKHGRIFTAYLNENDKLSLLAFNDRLEEAVKFFSVRREGFVPFLRKTKIHILNTAALRKSFHNFKIFYALRNDPVAFAAFKRKDYMNQLYEAWMELAKGDSTQLLEQRKIFDEVISGKKDPPQELENLILYAVLGDFEREVARRGITTDDKINWRNPEIAEDFVKGVLLNFALLKLPDNDTKITEEIIRKTAVANKGLLAKIGRKHLLHSVVAVKAE